MSCETSAGLDSSDGRLSASMAALVVVVVVAGPGFSPAIGVPTTVSVEKA